MSVHPSMQDGVVSEALVMDASTPGVEQLPRVSNARKKMDASIPGHYGFKRRSAQRQAALDLVWQHAWPLVEAELSKLAAPPECEVQWSTGLDPADGQLDPERAERKRSQVSSLAAHALEMMA